MGTLSTLADEDEAMGWRRHFYALWSIGMAVSLASAALGFGEGVWLGGLIVGIAIGRELKPKT